MDDLQKVSTYRATLRILYYGAGSYGRTDRFSVFALSMKFIPWIQFHVCCGALDLVAFGVETCSFHTSIISLGRLLGLILSVIVFIFKVDFHWVVWENVIGTHTP